MQFKNIGEFIKLANSNNSFFDLSNLAKSIGDINKVADALKRTKNISDDVKIAILASMDGVDKKAAMAALGITSVGTASTTAATGVTGLGAALKGLWASNPFLVIAMGATVAITAITGISSAINNYKQEQVSAAKQAASAWSEQNDSLQSQIDKITELRTTLADSNTTEEEAYNAKKELFDIQQQLNSQYGSAVAGIDLVNGSLKEQIDLLNQASEAEANKFLNENRKGIDEAKKKMTSSVGNGINGAAYLGQIMQFGDADESIQEILKKYTDKGISTMQNEADGTISIYFTGDATQAESVLNDFMTEVRAVGDEFGDSFSVDSVLENTGSVLKDAEDRISEYGELYNQARQAELLTQKQEYKVDDHKAQTASKWLKDYTDAINAYNDALVGGDSSQIEEAANNFEAVDQAVNALLDQTSMSEWSDQFTDARSKLNDAGIAYQDFYDKVSGKDLSDKGINSFVKDLKDLNLSDVDFKYALETDGVQEGEDAIQGLTTAAEEAGVPVDTLVGLLTDLGVISSGTAESVDEIATATDDASSVLEGFLATQDNINAALTSSMSATGLSAEQISNVADAYSELEGYNPAELFEVTANGVRFNTNALRELQAQQTATAKSQFASEIEKQNQLLDEQQQKISDLLASGASQEDILGAQADASGIQSQIDALIQLQAQLDGATSAYQRWLDAQSNGEEGDMYDSFQTAIERGDELLSQGLVGTNEFRAIADLFSSEDLSTAPVEQLVEAYNNASPIIKSFFTEGADGANAFIDKMISLGYATEDAETGLIDFSNVDTKQIADELGVDVEAVEAIFKKLGDYGFDIKVSANIDDVANEVNAAKQRLDEINGYNATAEVKIDATGDEQIQHTAELIASLPEEKQVEIGVQEAGNVDSIVQQLVNQPDSINIETTETKTVNEQLGETVDSVPDAEGKANFSLGNSPMTVPSASGVANFTLGNYPTSIPSVTQNVIVRRNVVTGTTEATGTMLSPAHADGNVALKHDEVALSNEQGQESIVRDGVWRLLPPGTHTEHFKKNDIIFNAAQTKQLLKNGKISGYGRTIGGAYANGTYNGMPAHANLYASGKRPGSYSSSGSSTNSGSGNTGSTGKSSKKKSSPTSEKVSKAIEKISKWVSNLFDWIEVRIDYLSKKADSYYTKAQNAIDLGLSNPNNYDTARDNIQKSISTNEQLVTANEQGSARYMKQANTIKKKYDGELGKKDKKSFNDAVAILNAGGKIDITKYSENVKKALEDYKNYYDKATECKYAVDDLNSTLIEQKEALYNLPIDEAAEKVEKLELALSNLNLTYTRISAGKNVNFATQNGNLEEQRINQLQQLIVQQEALTKLQNDVNSTSGTDHEIASAAYEKQLKTVAEAEKEYLEQQVDNEKQKFNNVKTYYENRINLLDKEKSLREASGAYESEKDYTGQLALTNQELANMKTQLESSIGSGIIQIGSEEWLELQSDILETEKSLKEMETSATKARLQEMFERAADSVQKLIDKLQTVNGLISDDMKFDYDGNLTQNGALSMILDSKSLEDSKEKLKEYAEERNHILTVEWHNKGYIGDYVQGVDSTLDDLLDGVDGNIKSEFSNIQSYLNSLLSTVISANEKERDAILEVVDAHKEALSRKKEYYDYDKKLKSQNKDISEVRQKMAALQGSTDKKDIAKLQQLQAKLKELQDEKDDTVKEHLYDMQTDALDQISDDISKYYEKIIAEMKESPVKASEAIAKYLSDNGISSDNLAQKISDVLSQYLDPKGTNKTETDNTIKNSGLTGNNAQPVSEETKQKLSNFKDLVSKLGTDYGSDEMQSNINNAMAAYNQMNDTEKSYAKADKDTLGRAITSHTTVVNQRAEAARIAEENARKAAEEAARQATEKAEQDRIAAAAAAVVEKAKQQLGQSSTSPSNSSSSTSTQSNKKLDKGDKITATGIKDGASIWKYSNKKNTNNKQVRFLKNGETFYVGEYRSGDNFPVHLYSDKNLKKPVGWAAKHWFKGYEKGASSVKGDQLAWINENWKTNGGEIIYRKSDGAMLMPLGNGDTVFSADKVQALYKMLETNPLPINMGNVFSPRDLTTQVQTVNNTPVNYSDSHDIIVQGDLTRDTLPDLQSILKQSSKYTQNEIRKDLEKNGRKKTFH